MFRVQGVGSAGNSNSRHGFCSEALVPKPPKKLQTPCALAGIGMPFGGAPAQNARKDP